MLQYMITDGQHRHIPDMLRLSDKESLLTMFRAVFVTLEGTTIGIPSRMVQCAPGLFVFGPLFAREHRVAE